MDLRQRADASVHPRAGRWLLLLWGIAAAFGCAGGDDRGGLEAERVSAEEREIVGTTYQVGPARQYKNLGQVAQILAPGDIVEVDGNATYPSVKFTNPGTSSQKITIRGLRVSGKRPVLSGGTNTVELNGDYYLFEGFDVTGGSARCIYHHAANITIRDSVVHDCPKQGILGGDYDTGNLTLDYVEVHHAGGGIYDHQIYVATDQTAHPGSVFRMQTAHPGSVFRMQHCYVHDGNGGNDVKSRAERNEIYYNWIESAYYKELELIGTDGQDQSLAREDSDVVGNVLRATTAQFMIRLGGDGTGDTKGRYRFVNNTIILAQGTPSAFWLYDGIESLEMHNNVFYRTGGGGVTMIKDDASWSTGKPLYAGSKNAVPTGSTYPAQWTGTITTGNPGFVNIANRDLHLASGSPLIDAGAASTSGPAGYSFPSPLAAPLSLPPPGVLEAAGTALVRPVAGTIDIGAFEFGVGGGPPPPPPPPGGCVTANSGEWKNGSFATQTGTFTAVFDATPSAAPINGSVALSSGPQSTWTGLAAIVHFSPLGTILVRKGSSYLSDVPMTYTAGKTYHVRMVVNVLTDSYSVYVTPALGAEVLLASSYGFRTEQVGVPSLNTWDSYQLAEAGALKVCNFALQ
jgi:hypothetical protein